MSNFFIRFIMKNARKPEGFFGRVFAKSMGNGHDPMAKWALGSFRFNDGDRLLDVGCGGGRNIQHLFELYPGSAVDGVDYSPESVRVSRKLHAARLGDQCRIEEGNVMALPFADATYGGVMGCETIYFWPDLVGGLKEIWRVLKPGGRIILMNEVNDPKAAKIWMENCPEMRVYTEEDQVDALKQAGFMDVEGKTKDAWSVVSGVKGPR
ncbi:hypothetical protein BEQ56_04615 [Anaerolineaceae bacterium oral taxon 439]|nr:hypothetical protein BEQ56_04615 [Anaerolineaceae bacterium oral taxon 439]